MSTYQDEFGNVHHSEGSGKAYSVTPLQAVLVAGVVALFGGVIGIVASGTKMDAVAANLAARSKHADEVKKHCDLAESESKAIESLMSETGAARLADVDAKAFVRCSRVK